jgi:hypothetical protein
MTSFKPEKPAAVLVFALALFGLSALAASIGMAGCFDPDIPDIAFRCGANGECPEGYECRDDECCHRIGSPDVEGTACQPEPDGGADGGDDGGVSGDGATDGNPPDGA